MEPVALIVAALAAGAVVASTDNGPSDITNAHAELRALVGNRLDGMQGAGPVLAAYEQAPDTGREQLIAALDQAGADCDQGLVAAATALMRLVDELGSRAGKYAVDLQGARGVQVGSYNTQVNINGDLRLEDASHRGRGEVLREYLTAALRAARYQPYPGVMPGTMPPLAAIYLRQEVRRGSARVGYGSADIRGWSSRALTSTDEVLALPGSCVVVGGPGGGKSSLLRTWTAELAGRLLQEPELDRTAAWVPVLVEAAAVADGLRAPDPLPDALASAAVAQVHGFLQPTSVLAELLRAVPVRDARWLVMIDGLDEINAAHDRERLLQTIAALAANNPPLYRFVITTRPAPDSELADLGSEIPFFELQPFSPGDLPTIVRVWFTTLAVPELDETVEAFLTSAHYAGLDGIVGIPLITAMLCQLYACHPDRPLPVSRGDLYGQFTDQLQEHYDAPGPGGLHAQADAEMSRHGRTAADAADRFVGHLLDLITHLAAERWHGNTAPAMDIIAAHPLAEPPAGISATAWRSFLDSSLRRSGLLIPVDGDLVFLHQTFLEYLAARYAARTPQTLATALRDATGQTARYRSGAADMAGSRRPGRRYWVPPPQAAASYIGFLLDAVQASSVPIRSCGVVFSEPGLNRTREGADFMIALLQTGTRLPDHLRQPTADLLYDLALANTPARLRSSFLRDGTVDHLTAIDDDHRARLRVIRGLAELGDPRGAEILYFLAVTLPPGIDEISRKDYAQELAQLGDPRGAELLAGFAGDPDFSDGARAAAAGDLARLADPRGADLLAALAGDRRLDGHERVRAANDLAQLGDPRGSRLLQSLALASLSEIVPVAEAARRLVELGNPSAAEALHFIATWNYSYIDRVAAARELAKLGDSRAASAWLAIASTSGLQDDSRVEAARELTKLGDPLAVDAWRVLALDPERDSSRVAATRELAKLDDPRVADTWRVLAHDPRLRPGSRVIAVEELVKLRDPRAADTCHALAHDPDLAGGWRIASARGLAELGDLRAASTWRALAHDRGLDHDSRTAAAGELTASRVLGSVTGSALTVTSQGDVLMVTASQDGMMRLWRADGDTLNLLGEPQEGHPIDFSVKVAVGQLGDRLVAVTGGMDGSVRLWQVTSGGLVQTGEPQRNAGTESIAVGQLGDHLTAFTGGSSASVQLWRVHDGGLTPAGARQFHGHYWVGAVTFAKLSGNVVAITCAADGSVQLWRVSDDGLAPAGDPHPGGPGDMVQTVAAGEVGGRLMAITGGSDGSVQMWRVSDDGLSPAGDPRPGHAGPVQAAAVRQLNGHLVTVTGGRDGTVRLWRADDQELMPAGEPQPGHGERGVGSAAFGQTSTRQVAVTGGYDGTVRLWRVSHDGLAPLSGL